MKVKALTEHRYEGETKEVGKKTYELPNDLATRAIAEGWVEAVVPKKK
jgi:hypothetical protein